MFHVEHPPWRHGVQARTRTPPGLGRHRRLRVPSPSACPWGVRHGVNPATAHGRTAGRGPGAGAGDVSHRADAPLGRGSGRAACRRVAGRPPGEQGRWRPVASASASACAMLHVKHAAQDTTPHGTTARHPAHRRQVLGAETAPGQRAGHRRARLSGRKVSLRRRGSRRRAASGPPRIAGVGQGVSPKRLSGDCRVAGSWARGVALLWGRMVAMAFECGRSGIVAVVPPAELVVGH